MNLKCEICDRTLGQGKRFCSYKCMVVPIEKRFELRINRTETCWLWTGKSKTEFGYGRISYFGKPERAHRVAYILYVGKIPTGKHVLHTCDIPLCVNPKHLYIGSNKENGRDRSARNRIAIGENNPLSKYPNRLVSTIRKKFAIGTRVNEAMSVKYGLSRRHLKDIIEYKTRRNG